MKKYLVMAAFAVTGLFFFAACGDEEEENESQDSTVTLTEPVYKNDAIKFNVNQETTIKSGKILLQSLELTESGRYLLTYEPGDAFARATRGATIIEYMTGYYTKQADGTYDLANYGKINYSVSILGATNSYTLTLSPTGSERMEVKVERVAPLESTRLTGYLCRTWTIANVIVKGTVKNVSVAMDFGRKCSVNELLDFLKDKGADIKDNVPANTVVDGITFTRSKTYLINYSNGKQDVGTWNWTNQQATQGSITYKWNESGMGTSIDSGRATVEFAGSLCRLTLPATISGNNIEVIYVMR